MIATYPKVNDLIDRLTLLAESPNEFQLRGIEREAHALLKHDAHGAYIALAIIAAIRGDVDESISHHEKSLKLSNDALTRRLYVTSLNHLTLWREALDQADIILNQAPLPELLEICIEVSLRAAQPHRATTYYQMLAKLTPDTQPGNHLVKLMQTAEKLKLTGLTDEELTEMIAIAEDVARDFGATIVGSDVWLNEWEEPFFVAHDLFISGADAYAMSDELVERMVSLKPAAKRKWVDYLYIIDFAPAEEMEAA